MSRAPSTFRQQDATRALRAVTTAGLHVTELRIDPQTGAIVVVVGESRVQDSSTAFDQWKAKNAREA